MLRLPHKMQAAAIMHATQRKQSLSSAIAGVSVTSPSIQLSSKWQLESSSG